MPSVELRILSQGAWNMLSITLVSKERREKGDDEERDEPELRCSVGHLEDQQLAEAGNILFLYFLAFLQPSQSYTSSDHGDCCHRT